MWFKATNLSQNSSLISCFLQSRSVMIVWQPRTYSVSHCHVSNHVAVCSFPSGWHWNQLVCGPVRFSGCQSIRNCQPSGEVAFKITRSYCFVRPHTVFLHQCLSQFMWSNTINNTCNRSENKSICSVLCVGMWHAAAGVHDSLMVRRLPLPCNTTLLKSARCVREQAGTHRSVTLAHVSRLHSAMSTVPRHGVRRRGR